MGSKKAASADTMACRACLDASSTASPFKASFAYSIVVKINCTSYKKVTNAFTLCNESRECVTKVCI